MVAEKKEKTHSLDLTLKMLIRTEALHAGKEANAVRACMVGHGMSKEAIAWKTDADRITALLKRVRVLVADGSSGHVRKLLEVMSSVREVHERMSAWNRMMAQDRVLAGLRSEECVQRFFVFLRRMFTSAADGYRDTGKSLK